MEINEKMDKDIRLMIEDVLYRSQFAKNEMCKNEPMSDNPPMFLIGYTSDESNPAHDVCLEAQTELGLSQPLHIAMLPLIHKPDIYDCFEDIVKAMPIEKFEFIMFVVEGYVKQMDEGAEVSIANAPEKGELENDYKENPFSTVREAITITATDWNTAGIWNLTSTYGYGDNGIPVWDEPIANFFPFVEGEDTNGRLSDALIGATKYMHLATQTLAYKNLLDKAQEAKRNKGE